MTKGQLYQKYVEAEDALKNSLIENAKLKQKMNDMRATMNTNPKDKWYMVYLMKANVSLERQCDDRQEIIEQYQRHYNRYGHFYKELEQRLSTGTQ